MSEGYSYNSGQLDQIRGKFQSAHDQLADAANVPFDAPDVGASSALVGTTLGQLLGAVLHSTGRAGETAEKVHTARGAYDDVENTAAGRLTNEQHLHDEMDHGKLQMEYPPPLLGGN